MGKNNIGIPEYQKNMSMQEIVKTYYTKTEIGNSIFVIHKKSKDHQEYKFFCTSYQGKDYVLVAPKHWNADFATHSDLQNILFSFIGIDKKDIKRKLELYNTDFFKNAFHGTIGKDPKENIITFCCLDDCPDPTIKQERLKKIPENIQKVHKRLLSSLNRVIQSYKAKLKKPLAAPKITKKKQNIKPKPRRK